MIEERKDGWFVKNVAEAMWVDSEHFGRAAAFDVADPFPQTGIHLFVLAPGKPNCRYHRENAQEDFLVLSGRCTLLVNDEERELKAWDFVHLPAGVTHVFVGGGDGPCALLAIGHRPGEGKHEVFYPASELAARYGAQAPEPTADPKLAYADAGRRTPCEPPAWPPE
ncbi:MAG: cupin domain-containing protein [Planctomycetota bacterium]|nr:MAG: cupin domain-containing protein [Planctomycetota bacterium]